MVKNILITGGAKSGKTRWAVTHFAMYDYVLYLKVGEAVDADTLKRIEYNNKKNFVEWDIVTGVYSNPAEKVTDHKFVIFDSLFAYTQVCIKEMCPDITKLDDATKKSIEKRIIEDIMLMREKVDERGGCMIINTLETGFSVTPTDPEQAALREILGTVNQRIANTSDEVYFSASGIQFKIR